MSNVALFAVDRDAAAAGRRPSFLWAGFLFAVVLPVALSATYLYLRAADQYASTVGFSVRAETAPSPIELIGGIADLTSSGSADADILYAFIRSQEIVETLDRRLRLRELYARPSGDPVFAFDPEGSIEELTDYWQRMVRVVYDPGTGLIDLRVLAFDPDDAQEIAAAIYAESARLIDDLSRIARDDTTAFARAELDRAVERLKGARERLTQFRSATQIVDPSADLQGQMGLLGSLEAQLAAALIDADLLRESTRPGDPRLTQIDRRIGAIEARIAAERRKLGQGGAGGEGADYASLLAEFERLAVDREFAEEAYRAALAGLDQALAEARRKSRYLAAYIRPTRAETATHPRRAVLTATVGFFALCLWALVVLTYFSFRDRR